MKFEPRTGKPTRTEPPDVTPPYRLYEWYHGTPPPADDSLILTYPQVALFFTSLHLAGPDLTPEHYRDALFAFPPTPKARTQPSVDYGFGIWTDPTKPADEYRRCSMGLATVPYNFTITPKSTVSPMMAGTASW